MNLKDFRQKTGCFLRSPGAIVSIVLLIIIGGLFIVNECCYNVTGENYTSGIMTEFVGIIVTVLFVQFLFDKKSSRDSKDQEEKAIIRSNKVLQQHLKRYVFLYYCVTTPIADRNFENAIMPDGFFLKDMRDLHKNTLSIRDGIMNPSVDSFLEVELAVRNYMITMLNNIDFKYHSTLSSMLSSFIEASIAGDVRLPLSDMVKMSFERESGADFARNMLENSADTFYQELQNGAQHAAHVVYPYIFLYEMMNVERDLIRKYNLYVEQIENP